MAQRDSQERRPVPDAAAGFPSRGGGALFSQMPGALFKPQPAPSSPATPNRLERIDEAHPYRTSQIEWGLVYRLRERLTDDLSNATALGPDATNEDRLQYSRSILPTVVERFSAEALRLGHSEDVIRANLRDVYVRATEDAVFGYGRWTPLLSDPDVENIEIRGYNHTFMAYGDRITPVPPVADSDDELDNQVAFMATYLSKTPKTFSEATPVITLNLEDRFRLHAMSFNIVDRPTIVIRQHKHLHVTLEQLVGYDLMPAHVADFLAYVMIAGKALVVSGSMGAGKTTLLRALADALPPLRSIGVIETDPELFLHRLPGRYRVVNLVARDGSTEAVGPDGRPVGEFGVDKLLVASKRQNFDMVSVGEILGSEAALLFEAMQSGAGSFSTIHANDARATIERIVTAAAHGGILSPDDAYRQIATLMNLIIYIRTDDQRHRGGRLTRYIEEILEINGFADDGQGGHTNRPAVHTVYSHRAPEASLNLSPRLAEDLRRAGWHG